VVANAACVAYNQVFLEKFRLIFCYADFAEFPKSCGNTVDNAAFINKTIHVFPGFLDGCFRFIA
jgi:hypothetical protein